MPGVQPQHHNCHMEASLSRAAESDSAHDLILIVSVRIILVAVIRHFGYVDTAHRVDSGI
jgi:hypothetical protein